MDIPAVAGECKGEGSATGCQQQGQTDFNSSSDENFKEKIVEKN